MRAAPLPEWFHTLAAELRQWGRWGPDDELGTLNLVDGAAVRRGASSVARGEPISLSMPFGQSSPQVGSIPGRVNPLRTMVSVNAPYLGDPANACFSDDVVFMGLQASTHWDSLAHVSYGGVLWNGAPASTVTAEAGATRSGMHKVRSLTSRGVLVDLAPGGGRLAPGHPVTYDELDAACRVDIEPGDIVLVRTGNAQLLRQRKRTEYTTGEQPGLTTSCCRWFKERDVAAVATDTVALEVYPGEDPAALFPVHLLHLVDMGLWQGQNFDLEDLAEACAAGERWTFLLEASPIPFTGAVGAPVNPVAVL